MNLTYHDRRLDGTFSSLNFTIEVVHQRKASVASGGVCGPDAALEEPARAHAAATTLIPPLGLSLC